MAWKLGCWLVETSAKQAVAAAAGLLGLARRAAFTSAALARRAAAASRLGSQTCGPPEPEGAAGEDEALQIWRCVLAESRGTGRVGAQALGVLGYPTDEPPVWWSLPGDARAATPFETRRDASASMSTKAGNKCWEWTLNVGFPYHRLFLPELQRQYSHGVL